METDVYTQVIPDYYEYKDSLLRDRSVVHWPEKLDNIPLLVLHGTADKRVTYNEAELVAHKLDSLKYPYKLVSFEGDDHGLSNHGIKSRAIVNEWLDKYLKHDQPFAEAEKSVMIP